MAQDREQEVRLQFLEEAQEHLDTIDSGLLGLGTGGIKGKQIDPLLRAAHSIKGGAALMGFQILSDLAHRLEDFFKVLKVGKFGVVDEDIERLMLAAVERLAQVTAFNRQEVTVEPSWLETEVEPIFDQLHDHLGDPQPEDAAALLSTEAEEDMTTLLFQSEVEACLERLESVLEDPEQPCLHEEFLIAAQELEGLGQMLELTAFSSLCQSITEHLEAAPEQAVEIAQLAMKEWRRSQALVLVGQVGVLPSKIALSGDRSFSQLAEASVSQEIESALDFSDDLDLAGFELEEADTPAPEQAQSALDFSDDLDLAGFELEEAQSEATPNLETTKPVEANASVELDSLDNFDKIQQEALELFSSLETVTPSVRPSAKAEIKPEKIASSQISSASTAAATNKTRTSDQTIRISVKQLEELSNLFGELTIERNGIGLQINSLHNLVALLKQRVRQLEQSNLQLRTVYDKIAVEGVLSSSLSLASTASNSQSSLYAQSAAVSELSTTDLHNTFDILEMDRYSDMHLMSQEVMESVVQIQEVTTDLEIQLGDTEKNARELGRTSKLIENSITQVRMRPISDLIGHFPKALRKMELQYGKQVELKVKGGSTLIDRTVLEALNEPMLHLFRNAFDHGIEEPAARRAKGKPEKGMIEISAAHRGNQTIITIRDDGGGINLDKIRARAEQMGFEAEVLAEASAGELLDLIFEPGFSTADQVTDLSGRGVGMDVVRTNLQQIQGEVRVETKPGIGTTFIITVPFTLSVMRVLLVESNGLMLAFPTNAVEEVLLLQPEMVLATAGQEVLNWEGFAVSLIRLAQWLQFPRSHFRVDTEATPTIDAPTALIIAQDDDLVALQVDRYWGEQEVTIRTVEGNLKMPPGFTGCTVLGNGQVVPLVSALELLHWIDQSKSGSCRRSLSDSLVQFQSNLEQSVSQDSAQTNTVMVVDDSINVRRFLALTLEKAGYRVEQAKDGQDALSKLQDGLHVGAVVCDVEMPRLDGFGFLAQVKSDSQYQDLPIVMLTSRSGDKHRRMAMNLGATDYFSKPFKEQQLLQTLEELTAPGRQGV